MKREELEDLWRTRVAEAKLRFDTARNRTNAIVRDFPLEGTSSDGLYAYRVALRAEGDALAEYNRVLRIYTDLVHDGVIPAEDQWPRRKETRGSGRTA